MFSQLWQAHPQALCLLTQAQGLGMPHTYLLSPIGWLLNPPPPLLVEDNGASHPLRESVGGLGMVSFLAEHVLRRNDTTNGQSE